MPIEIGKIKLSKIHHIQTLEDANFVYKKVPGSEGEVVQDLGRATVRLRIEGIFYGKDRHQQLSELRQCHTTREPVDFIADMMDQAYASQVTIESLEVEEAAHQPDQLSFRIILREYIKPPSNSNVASVDQINKKIQMDAQTMLEISSLPDALSMGSIPELTNPFEPLSQALDPIKEAGSGLSNSMKALNSILG